MSNVMARFKEFEELHIPKVLLIEDDESSQCLIMECLKRSVVVNIVLATGAIEGKVQFVQNQVDLVICDQNMNDGLGTEVLRFIRETGRETPFLLFTSQDRETLPNISSFEHSYVQKPHIDRLIREVTQMLSSHNC